MKISGVYKITNTATGDFYIGSSNNIKKRQKEYNKEYQIEYYQQNREKRKEYQNQLCCYNGQTLTLNALAARFYRAGIEHPTLEAKKYLINKESKTPIECYDVYP